MPFYIFKNARLVSFLKIFNVRRILSLGFQCRWKTQIKFLTYLIIVACFFSSRTDLLCSPRIAAGEGGEALCLVTHLVSYRGSKNCTQIKTKLPLQLGSQKEEFNPSWEYKPCTTIPVFYWTRCEDWTAIEVTSQQSFQGSQLPILHMGCSYG